jgi:hypothetical protein
MTSNLIDSIDGEAAPHKDCRKANPEHWLSLAAAPAFATMALLTIHVGGAPNMLCSTAQDASPLSGMAPMYLLMSACHLAPWLRLVSRR